MDPADRCELHEVAIVVGRPDSEELVQLARSPIGDECRMCPICRLAREYVDRRLAEGAGLVFPAEESGEAVWRRLRSAVEGVKTSVHRPG